jgi:dTDP-4-dehydrorhamnose reductase
MMQRILLIGKNGQLGWELRRTLAPLGDVTALDYPEIDLAEPESLRQVIRGIAPNLIVNAAAYTNVDKAETERELAFKINSTAPGVMAEEARLLRAGFIHYSTDFVFDGIKANSYIETDAPLPLNVYGASKLEGENAVKRAGGAALIFRTSWVYSMRQGGFVTKVLEWASKQGSLRIVDDQFGSPTSARMLAEVSAQVIAQGRGDMLGYLAEKAGLYHLAGSGSCSRYDWAREIVKLAGLDVTVEPAKTVDFPSPAIRPLHPILDCAKFTTAFNLALPGWRDALALLFAG